MIAAATLLWAVPAWHDEAAAAKTAERVPSEDGAFSVEAPPRWTAVRGKGGRVLDLKGPSINRLLIVGEWRDGTVAAPAEEFQERLLGADSATLTRPDRPSIQYGRRPAKKGVHLQGRLTCSGGKYIFDAVVEYEQSAWTALDSFACKGGDSGAGIGVDIGESGWRVTIPPGFQRRSPTLWLRRIAQQGFNQIGLPARYWRTQQLRVLTGSETWSSRRPWDTCAFWDNSHALVEPARQELHRGKMSFLQKCAANQRPSILVYDLIYDYDGALGQAAYITLRLQEYWEVGDETYWQPEGEPVPDGALLGIIAATLEPGEKKKASDETEPASPAAVPLLR